MTTPSDKLHAHGLVKIEISDNRINYVCLRQKCPCSCCGPFGGVQHGIDSVEGRNFAEIVLTTDDWRRLMDAGCAHLVERAPTGGYRMCLLEDGTCMAFENGQCSINDYKPTLCRAFPFYIDMFVGLCGVTGCPGFGSGWTPLQRLSSEIEASRKMYDFWISTIKLPDIK